MTFGRLPSLNSVWQAAAVAVRLPTLSRRDNPEVVAGAELLDDISVKIHPTSGDLGEQFGSRVATLVTKLSRLARACDNVWGAGSERDTRKRTVEQPVARAVESKPLRFLAGRIPAETIAATLATGNV